MSDEQGSFVPVGETEQRMFGPRGILLCGFTNEGQRALVGLWGEGGLSGVPVFGAGMKDAAQTCLELLTRGGGLGDDSELPRAIVVSGLLEQELHLVMRLYRQSGAPRPLWAALTEHSQDWRLGDLLGELQQEKLALEQANREKGGQK